MQTVGERDLRPGSSSGRGGGKKNKKTSFPDRDRPFRGSRNYLHKYERGFLSRTEASFLGRTAEPERKVSGA